MLRNLILISSSLCALSFAATDADRERRKREFLNRPIFVETVRKRAQEAKEKAEFNPNPRRVELPKELRQVPETNLAQRRPNDLRQPQAVAASSGNAPKIEGRKDGQCGYDKFIGNFCHYRQGKGWLLCTDRWGGCIQQEER